MDPIRREAANPTTLRTLAVLELLAERAPLGVSEIAQSLTMPKSTVLGVLEALMARAYVVRVRPRGPYALGQAVIDLGQRALGHSDIRACLRPAMNVLVAQFGETVNLGVWSPDRSSVLYVDKVDGVHSIRVAAYVGKSNPCHCTAIGKALLTGLTDAEFMAYLGRVTPLTSSAPSTITSPAVLIDHIARRRLAGFCGDDQEHEIGVRCVGIPVRDRLGAVVAAISLAAPADRLPHAIWRAVAGQMVSAVNAHASGAFRAEPPTESDPLWPESQSG